MEAVARHHAIQRERVPPAEAASRSRSRVPIARSRQRYSRRRVRRGVVGQDPVVLKGILERSDLLSPLPSR